MRKPDEIALARAMLEYGPYGDAHHIELMVDTGTPVSPAWRRIGMNENRACYIFTKWARRGWSDSDISLRHSWLTSEGVEAWTSILSTCDSTDDGKCETRCIAHVVVTFTGGYYDISLGHSYCPKVENRYLGPAVFNCEEKVFVTTCAIPLLE